MSRRKSEGETGRRIGTLAAGMFMGSLYVFLFGSVIMFDLLLLAWVLLGWIALLMVHRGSSVARGTGLFGLAIGLAAMGCGIAQGVAAFAALQGIARNPSAAGKIQTPMIIGLALIESLCIYALVIGFLLQAKL